MKEVFVSQGANGSLCSYIQAFVNPGDQLVTFEPMFPMYLDHVALCAGQIKTVPLTYTQSRWRFNGAELRAALASGPTKMLVLNSPHNPTGKVFSREEYEEITSILKDFPEVVVLSDEVYDFLTFDDREHVHFASIGDNWDKTVSVFSGGKLLNATGWKVGWAVGP